MSSAVSRAADESSTETQGVGGGNRAGSSTGTGRAPQGGASRGTRAREGGGEQAPLSRDKVGQGVPGAPQEDHNASDPGFDTSGRVDSTQPSMELAREHLLERMASLEKKQMSQVCGPSPPTATEKGLRRTIHGRA